MTTANKWEQFEDALREHDWFYHMSDDHSMWLKGKAQADIIRGLYKELEREDAQRAINLYEHYRLPLKPWSGEEIV